MYTHKHTHADTHTYTHTHTHACTSTHTCCLLAVSHDAGCVSSHCAFCLCAIQVVVKQYNNLAQWLVLRPFCSEVRVHTALGDSPYFMPLKAAVMDPHTGTGVLVMPKAHGDLRQW